MLQIKGLVKRFGDVTALDHLDLDVKEGEIFGLLGPNGSGKSTTIGCILALLTYDRGEIRLFGQEMSPTAYELKKQIGVVFQDIAVFDRLSVYENVDYFCGLYVSDPAKRKQLVEEALASTGLQDYVKKRPKQLSGGLLRRLNIACGIAHKPRLIILDEPTVAVDPQSRNRILEDIVALNKAGSTIIYTSHYMEEVEQMCTRIAIIDHGRQVACGSSQELKEMIRTGETVTVEGVVLSEAQLEAIRRMKQVYDLSYSQENLKIKYENSSGHLMTLLHYFEQEHIAFANVFSAQPTLNDVFLEITGKELRD